MPNDDPRLGDRLLAAWAHPAGSRRALTRSRPVGPPPPRSAEPEEAEDPTPTPG